ncbi:MAG: SUMF1/EgtB/PvdO family nonheme iron enzyme [Candidatus Riflebacteria bacterium]|nr:SUMF1/EgtB/PvdO family nonheme iron enzyme [Candidatus Riflebacteria bacterium]
MAVSVIALAVAALVSYLRAPAPLAAVPVSVHLGSSRARVVWSGPPDGPALARYRPDRPDATWVEVEERTPPARGRHDLTLERLDAGTVYRLELLRSAGAGPVASVRVPVPAAGTRVMRLLEEVARGVPGPVGDPDRIVVGLLDPDDLARLRQILGEARDTLLEGRELAELSRTRGLAAASLLSCAAPEHASFVAATTARILDAPPRASDSVWLAAVGHNLAPDLGLLRGALLEATRGRGRFRTMTEARAGLLVARAHWLAGRVEEAIAAARQVNQRFPGMMEPYALLLEMGVAGLAIPEVVTCEADGAPMAYVPPGHFWMGSSLEDPDAERDEMPIHVVRLSGFFIDRFLVSKGRFAPFNAWVARLNDHSRCHESSSCRKARRWSTHTLMDEDEFIAGVAQTVPARKGELAQVLPQGSDDHPVTSVSWFDAFSYAAWAGKELPTEAQWEKAARGDDKRLYPWGNEPPTVQLANFRELIGHLTPVDQFARVPSPYGAKDMVGNAWQWCADWYHEAWYREQLDRPADPTGPPTGWRRSQRGGAWYNSRVVLRVANRDSASPSSARLQRWGFRTVRTIRRLDRGR